MKCNSAAILFRVLEAQGVRDIVISPGSRNAALIAEASKSDSFKCTVIADERTAGFFALGKSLVSQKPVVLVCTSGTAMYNYAAAVAEAYYQKIPLIVITADRPRQWIDQDDSQTLKQPGALDKIVKRSYDIPADGMQTGCSNAAYDSEWEWFVNRVANEAFITSIADSPGPVHINIQFSGYEDLLGNSDTVQQRLVKVIASDDDLSVDQTRWLSSQLFDKRVMVVAGFMPPDDKLNRAISMFARHPNVTVVAETISNLHLEGHVHMIDALLAMVDERTRQELVPDIVISIGGAIVSRMLKDFLRKSVRTEHWTLSDTDVSVDCFQRLTTHIDINPRSFFSIINRTLNQFQKRGRRSLNANYAANWNWHRNEIWKLNEKKISEAPWSELKALNKVFADIPQDINLFLSNGTPIRYAQLLMDRMPHACFCNRGVSGIDGTNATALGASAAFSGTTILITGDMSFSYCPEMLNMIDKGRDLRIVLINNSGGGIFRFVATTRDLPMREEFFCSSPELPVKKIAKAYGWTHVSVKNESELEKGLETLLKEKRTLLEISVDPDTSASTLLNFLQIK